MSVLFPKWINAFPTVAALAGAGGLAAAVGGFWHYATPKYWEVGYMPLQPGGGFNHQIHAGKLGMDCRYCHTKVEKSPEANIPNVATCYGCHFEGGLAVLGESDAHRQRTQFVRDAYAQDSSIEWKRIHKLPDYVRNFPHHVHVKAGVSCYSCHGQITAMPVVFQAENLSMGWCLECHRGSVTEPEKYLVPPDKVTQLQWVEEEWFAKPAANNAKTIARDVLHALQQSPPENCGACHY
ncbi:MAG: cytochrome c3 family protein [Planctomycetota bacterium]|nr:cytochrome c3 family protein [Planctomycetota bacterium]